MGSAAKKKGKTVSLAQPELFALLEPDRAQTTPTPELFREVASFPPFEDITNGELFSLSLSNRTPNLTHGLHRFAAKYIPRIPAWVLSQFATQRTVVLDPFCGSGTTLVEGLSRCKTSIGIDCDPMACMISGAKTSAIRHERIQELGQHLRKMWHGPTPELHTPMPGVANFGHWFSQVAWGDLQCLLGVISSLSCTAQERNFLRCIFSSILRYVSNADDQTQKTYVSGTLKKNPPEVAPAFWKAFAKALTSLKELEAVRLAGAEAKVVQGDAADIQLPASSVDLVITSPPYLDSVDYMYNFMLEYFWLGPSLGVADRKTFNHLRRSPTGAKNPLERNLAHLPACLNNLISEKDIPASRISATRMYCASMARHFKSAARVMKKDAHYVLVIGNSKTGKGVLPIHDSLIRLAADAGFAFQKAFAYRIRRHYMKFPRGGRGGIITMDWVIVLKNAGEGGCYPDRLPLPDFTLRADEVAN
jgi:DNA modification methylase